MADEAATTPKSVADPGTATPTLLPGTATGTATPMSAVSIPLNAQQRTLSLKVSLADLTARASGLYAQKKFDEAAEVYAQAAEMQAEMNGEMSPENAEILFLYGRSLFKVGQSKSDVLGGKAPATEGGKPKQQQKKVSKKANGAPKAEPAPEPTSSTAAEDKTETLEAGRVAQEAVKIIADDTEAGQAEKKEVEAKKPLFQFTGDENFADSDEEEEVSDNFQLLLPTSPCAHALTCDPNRPVQKERATRMRKRMTTSQQLLRFSTWPVCCLRSGWMIDSQQQSLQRAKVKRRLRMATMITTTAKMSVSDTSTSA
jgi:hypothetical protein